MKTKLFTLFILFYFNSFCQSSFEGEIIYQNYDEEMKPIDKTIYKIKGDKVVQYIHNDKKNYIYYVKDSITFYKIGDEFKNQKAIVFKIQILIFIFQIFMIVFLKLLFK